MRYDPKIYSTSNLFSPSVDEVEVYFDRIQNDSIVPLFEERFAEYHESRYCIAFSTGFWALVASIIAKTYSSNRGHVLMPSMTYRRLADVVNWTGLIPKFVDIDPQTLAMCPKSLSKSIDGDSALILAVHPIINCCAVNDLIEIADATSIPILFDAVESVHETYQEKKVGGFGVGEVFSLHASKLINGVEGGYVCTDNEDLAGSLRAILGQRDKVPGLPFIDAEINPVHCAYALSGLDALDRNTSHNRLIYEEYQIQLTAHPFIELIKFDESEQTSFKNIVVKVADNSRLNRDQIVEKLNKIGIFCRAHYFPALHDKQTSYDKITADLPVTNHEKHRYLNLPCGQRFQRAMVGNVVHELNRVLGL